MNYSILPIVLLAMMLIIMLMRIMLPIGTKMAGRRIKEIRLSFKERVLLQRINIYAIGAVLVLTAATGVLPQVWEIVIIFAVLVLLLMRVHYLVTTDGIALNNVVYRSWKDFTGFEVTRRGIRLIPRQGLRPFNVRVLGKHQQEALVLVRSHLPESRRVEAAE